MRCVDFFSGSAWSLSVFHTASHMGLGTRSSFFAGRQSWRLASKVAGVGLGGDSGAPLAVQASLHTCLPSLSHLRCLGQTPGSSMVPRVLSCFCNDVQIRGEPSPPPLPHTAGSAPGSTGPSAGDSTQVCGLPPSFPPCSPTQQPA